MSCMASVAAQVNSPSISGVAPTTNANTVRAELAHAASRATGKAPHLHTRIEFSSILGGTALRVVPLSTPGLPVHNGRNGRQSCQIHHPHSRHATSTRNKYQPTNMSKFTKCSSSSKTCTFKISRNRFLNYQRIFFSVDFLIFKSFFFGVS